MFNERVIWNAPAAVAGLCSTRDSGLEKELGCDSIQWLTQVHGDACVFADASTVAQTPQADAAWTNEAGIAIAIRTADCVPILLAASDGSCIGAAHAGWRGLRSGVIANLVRAMPVNPDRLVAWIGPAISVAHYEVGEDVWAAFVPDFPGAVLPHDSDGSKRMLDLSEIARLQLQKERVGGVASSGLCTYSESRLCSYRRAQALGGDAAGRIASLVTLR